ncbi:Protein far1-related sequence 5 [Rhynchospora pubera]|uniref:Protein far1-related sequence 5 n=1 Tax=Rhynchospora pubera TaxID=906938 RepID=A0AAV8CVX4_9POAL|nr:Protein far1-related sequence 5 [Rhynchospora pubera]
MATQGDVAASYSTGETPQESNQSVPNEASADSTGPNLSGENSVQSSLPVEESNGANSTGPNEESSGANSTSFIPELRVGLEFASKEAAFEYYKKYSYLHGFGVYSNGGFSADGKKKRVIYRCHKARNSRSGKVKPVPEKKRVQEKTGCLANINVCFNPLKELWFISSFVTEHNHELAPEFSHKIKSHRSMKFYVKKQLEINENAGLPTIGNINVVMQMCGGEDVCGFTERDARNVLEKLRRSGLKNGDAEAMMSFFRQTKEDDPDFYYACKFSEENRLEIVFWADSVSRAAYRYFGDAVSFDATYIVNK